MDGCYNNSSTAHACPTASQSTNEVINIMQEKQAGQAVTSCTQVCRRAAIAW